ncbi:MAG: chorismate mutase [Acidobacteriota bacterium]|nr:chorismate mutase [Acidobacteriota bacterium]
MSADQLTDCRTRIDAVDLRILALLNERTTIVQEIGRIKQRLALPIYEPKREDQVYHNVTSNNAGPLSAEALKRVFERIIDEMRTVQRDKMQTAPSHTGQQTEPRP